MKLQKAKREDAKRQEEARKVEDYERENKGKHVETVVRAYLRSNVTRKAKIKRDLDVEKKKKLFRDQARTYRKTVKLMQARVKQRPLLIETHRQDLERVKARRKALLGIKESLEASGITDYKRFFDEDELEDLDISLWF